MGKSYTEYGSSKTVADFSDLEKLATEVDFKDNFIEVDRLFISGLNINRTEE